MHSKRRHKIFVCSVILGELQSFRNYKNYERANFSDSPLHLILESEHFSFPPITKSSLSLDGKMLKNILQKNVGN